MATIDSLIAKLQDRIAARLGLLPRDRPEAARDDAAAGSEKASATGCS
ncbi:MAG: hypothetical protein ABI467_05955 [Kofleriaceae bacterium]